MTTTQSKPGIWRFFTWIRRSKRATVASDRTPRRQSDWAFELRDHVEKIDLARQWLSANTAYSLRRDTRRIYRLYREAKRASWMDLMEDLQEDGHIGNVNICPGGHHFNVTIAIQDPEHPYQSAPNRIGGYGHPLEAAMSDAIINVISAKT